MSSFVRAETAVAKNGDEIEICVNAEPGELEQEMRLAEPYLSQSEFPPEAEKAGVMQGVGPMKICVVYDKVPTAQRTQEEQIGKALDGCRVKIWKTEAA